MSGAPRVIDELRSPADRLRELVELFAHDLVAGLMDAELHTSGAPQHLAHLTGTAGALREALAEGADSPLRLDFRRGRIWWRERALVGASLQAGRFLRLMEARGVTALGFDLTADGRALAALLELLRDERAKDAFRPQAIAMVLRARGIRGVAVELAPQVGAVSRTPQSAQPDRGDNALGAGQAVFAGYQALADALSVNHVRAKRGGELEIDQTHSVVERAVATMGTAPSDLLALAVYDDIDRFTVGHSVRVALLALQVARAAGAPDHQLLLVGTAGLLHDIGKSLVPQTILFKRGRLDDAEWREMAEHPRLGAELLLEQADVHPTAIGAAYCHHMAPNGHGYPKAPMPFCPSGISRLVRVCDVFEALTAVRPYKRDLTPLEALAIMHREAHGFDPHWFRFFVQTIGVYPVGTRVRLDSGERALVVRQGITIDRPVVRVIADGGGDDLPAVDAVEFAIGDRIDGVTRTIDAVVRRRRGPSDEDPAQRSQEAVPHPCLAPPSTPGANA